MKEELVKLIGWNEEGVPVDLEEFYLELGEIWRPPDGSVSLKQWGEVKGAGTNRGELAQLARQRRFGMMESRMQKKEGDDTICLVFADLPGLRYVSRADLIHTLEDHGWRSRKTSRNLLSDFHHLANNTDVKYFIDFVTHWGPLWLCCSHLIPTCDFISCIWSPSASFRDIEPRSLGHSCTWFPVEPVDDFIRVAKAIDAILRISVSLKAQEAVTRKLWREVAPLSMLLESDDMAEFLSRADSKLQRTILNIVLNHMLSNYDAGRLHFRWTERGGFALRFYSGWGFLRATLLELIGRQSGSYLIYPCVECGTLILPEERKKMPKKGQRVFCENCRGKRSKHSMRKER